MITSHQINHIERERARLEEEWADLSRDDRGIFHWNFETFFTQNAFEPE